MRIATVAALLPIIAVAGVCTPAAQAARKPTSSELRHIKRAAMRTCTRIAPVQEGYPCQWRGRVKVSTADPRYAWASVSGPDYDHSGVLRRGSGHSTRWKVIRVQGGGVQPCTYWTRPIRSNPRAVPDRVAWDLNVRASPSETDFSTFVRCGHP